LGAHNVAKLKLLFHGTYSLSPSSIEGWLRGWTSMQKFFMSVAALQFVLAAASVQPVSISTQIPSLSVGEMNKIGEIMTIRTAQSLVPIGVSLTLGAVVPSNSALRGLPANLTAGAFAQSGIASFYSGGLSANGEDAVASELTAAHRTLPFGTRVRVTNVIDGSSVVVRINDRGPFIAGRVIDLTAAGAWVLGFSGLAPVTLALEGGGM
jgi:rare lipoprotein A